MAVVAVVAVVACCVQCVRGTPPAILPRSSWTPSQLHSRRPVTPCVHRLAGPAPTLWMLCESPTENLSQVSSDTLRTFMPFPRTLYAHCRYAGDLTTWRPQVVSEVRGLCRFSPRTDTTRGLRAQPADATPEPRHATPETRHARNTPRHATSLHHTAPNLHRTFTERQVRSWRTPHPGLRPRHRQGRAMPRRAADRPAPPSGQRRSEP